MNVQQNIVGIVVLVALLGTLFTFSQPTGFAVEEKTAKEWLDDAMNEFVYAKQELRETAAFLTPVKVNRMVMPIIRGKRALKKAREEIEKETTSQTIPASVLLLSDAENFLEVARRNIIQAGVTAQKNRPPRLKKARESFANATNLTQEVYGLI